MGILRTASFLVVLTGIAALRPEDKSVEFRRDGKLVTGTALNATTG